MFKLLDCDDDVLLFGKESFTVGRFKELVQEDFYNKFNLSFQNGNSRSSINDTFSHILLASLRCKLEELKWDTSIQDFKLLEIGSKGWQKGKIIIHICKKMSVYLAPNNFEVFLEFCPDEPSVPESPLDDLRQLPEYKNGTSHV